MSALLAILITVGLVAGCWVASALVYFDLSWILFGVTSIWAAIDSKRIGLKHYKLEVAASPIAVFCLCYLLWIIIFPLYLWARFKIKDGTAVLKSEATESTGSVKRFFGRFSRVASRVGEWGLIGIVALKIGFLIFCIEESWRGQREWESYKHELEAKGESFDWDAMIPPSVPDSKNFFAAPMMSEWFIKPSGKIIITEDLSKHFNYTNSSAATVIANLVVQPPGSHLANENTDILLRFDDPASREQIMSALQNVFGPCVFGAQGSAMFVTKPPNFKQIRPLHLVLEANHKPTVQNLLSFFNNQNNQSSSLTIRSEGTNSYQMLSSFSLASDYLQWSGQRQIIFDRIREALKRPYARMDGDYSYPPTIPLPNFAAVRTVAQTLAQRAQCHLLLGQPEKALQDLTLLHDLCRLLEGAPTGKPMTLVATMINVAITGLYVNTVADGFRLHAWLEPQLNAIQKQLGQINLAPFLRESLHEEQVSAFRTFQVAMSKTFEIKREPNATLWQKIKNLRPPYFMRGFFYFNVINTVKLQQELVGSIDLSRKVVLPQKAAEFQREVAQLDHSHVWNIYKLLAVIAVPNFDKALKTFAFEQMKANEAEVVCALERYHHAHSNYPETLSELAPQFIGELPHDIIGGQPLKYHRTTDGHFLLYSVGWNGIDDGGQLGLLPYNDGDWVWQ